MICTARYNIYDSWQNQAILTNEQSCSFYSNNWLGHILYLLYWKRNNKMGRSAASNHLMIGEDRGKMSSHLDSTISIESLMTILHHSYYWIKYLTFTVFYIICLNTIQCCLEVCILLFYLNTAAINIFIEWAERVFQDFTFQSLLRFQKVVVIMG